ncbi:MAG: hypothetical protein Q7S17_03370, partial [Xanthobacteraceae bacterium]|nr:hypothetical protein [Xanthobacteraceae bacterium]
MTTPPEKGRQQQDFNVPASYQRGPSGFTGLGANGGYYIPHEISYTPVGQTPPTRPEPTAGMGPWQDAQKASAPGQLANPIIQGLGGVVNDIYSPKGDAPAPVSARGGGGGQPPDRQAFIEQMLPVAQAWSEKTGIPPEYYLAINGSESNFGKADTLFGIKGPGNNYATHEVVNGKNVNITDSFAKSTSPDNAYQQFHDLIGGAGRYAPAWQQFQADKNPDALLQGINKAGYATDPGWAQMISGMAGDIRGQITGEAGQGFANAPTKPDVVPPVSQPPLPPLPNDNPAYGPKIGPATGRGESFPGMPPTQQNQPLPPEGFTWNKADPWVTAMAYPNSNEALPNRVLNGTRWDSTSESSRALPGTYPPTGSGINAIQALMGGGMLPQTQTPGFLERFGSEIRGSGGNAPDVWNSGPPAPSNPGFFERYGAMAQQDRDFFGGGTRPSQLTNGPADPFKVARGNPTDAEIQAAADQDKRLRDMILAQRERTSSSINPTGGTSIASSPTDPAQGAGLSRIFMSGPTIAHLANNNEPGRVAGLNNATGFDVARILADAHGGRRWTSGDAATDAVLAARILQGQGAPEPELTGRNTGSTGTFQSPKGGGLENVTRMDNGYSFSPGSMGGTYSSRSPMEGADPIRTREGVVVRTGTDDTPAQKSQTGQMAGLPYIGPTSNPGAVYNAAFAEGRDPGSRDALANAANLPSAEALAAIAAAQEEKDAAAAGVDGGMRNFALGGQVTAGGRPNPMDPFVMAKAISQLQQDMTMQQNPKFSYQDIAREQWGMPRRDFAEGGVVEPVGGIDPYAPLSIAAPPAVAPPAVAPPAGVSSPALTDPSLLDPFQLAANKLQSQQHQRD